MQKWNNMMDKVEKKRQKEQHVVEEMIRLYCRKKHPKEDRQAGRADLSCLSGTFGLCKTSKSKVSIYGRKDVLCEL